MKKVTFRNGMTKKRTMALCVLFFLVLSFTGCVSSTQTGGPEANSGTVNSLRADEAKGTSVYDALPVLNVIYGGETAKAEPTTASWSVLGEDGTGGFCVDGEHPLMFKNGLGLIKLKEDVSELKLEFEREPYKVYIRFWFEEFAGDLAYADRYFSSPKYDKQTKTIQIPPQAGLVFEVTADWPEGRVYYGFWISDGITEGKRTAREDIVGKPRGVPVATETKADRALTSFALKLFKECVKNEQSKNTLISPLSVFTALSLAGCGATDDTLAEMEDVLGMKVAEFCDYSTVFSKGLLEKSEDAGKLDTANSVWYRDDPSFKINREFLESATEYFDAEVFASAFDDSTVEDVNSWVKDNTDGMIRNIIDRIDPKEVLLLINALSFDAKWYTPYKSINVKEKVFTTAEGEEKTVPFMYGTESAYLEDDKAKGFIKYYEGLKYGFAALLPEEGIDVDDYLAGLSGDKLRGLLADPGEYIVVAAMPKIKVDYSVDMKDILKSMGMARAFDPVKAQLFGIGTSESGNICIDGVIHKAFIEVNEEGTRAGAATKISGVEGGVPDKSLFRYITLNRPYIYMLLDLETNVPIFIGIMRDPE